MKRRILSVWFPRLASDHALRMRPQEVAFALTLRSGNSDHLHCLNKMAEDRGLRRGMGLTDARAICPDLATRPADLARESAALSALSRWMGRYAPHVGRDGTDGVVADITGVPHLFGGEAALLADLRARLDRAGLAAHAAIAETRGAAHALARHGGAGIVEPGQVAQALRPLPVVALRIDHDTAVGLTRLGLRTIGDLMNVARAPLARRFGTGLMLRLDQALGAQPEPVSPEAPEVHYGVRLTLPEPIGLTADVMAGLSRLLGRLCETLEQNATGARRLRLELRRVDGQAAVVEIGLARPMRDPVRMAALFRPGVEEVEAGFGIDGLRLTAPVVEPLAPVQIDTARQQAGDALADLITRLGNRIGFENVQRFLPAESLVPERSFLVVPAAYAPPDESHDWNLPVKRPVMIFPPEPIRAQGPTPPGRFRWRRMSFTTLRTTGPERITSEWWLDDPAWRSGVRDYWRVETHEGRRLWLFHTPQDPSWYVQGEFA